MRSVYANQPTEYKAHLFIKEKEGRLYYTAGLYYLDFPFCVSEYIDKETTRQIKYSGFDKEKVMKAFLENLSPSMIIAIYKEQVVIFTTHFSQWDKDRLTWENHGKISITENSTAGSPLQNSS